MVIAIKDDTPSISNSEYNFSLLQLVRDMLSKDWKKRNELVSDDRIKQVIISNNINKDSFEKSIEKILAKRLKLQASFDEIDKLKRTDEEHNVKSRKLGLKLKELIHDIFAKIGASKICNHVSTNDSFHFSNDFNKSNELIQNFIFVISGDLKMGYPKKLYILIRIYNNSEDYVEIDGLGMVVKDNYYGYTSPPMYLFSPLDKESRMLKNTVNRTGPPVINFCFDTIKLFKGSAEFDNAYNEELTFGIVNIISRTLEEVESIVESRINEQKKSLGNSKYFYEEESKIKEMIVINTKD